MMGKCRCIDCPCRFVVMEGNSPKEMDTPSGIAFACVVDGKILPDFVDEEHDNPDCPLEEIRRGMTTNIEVVETQSTIISLQSQIIDQLFRDLSQHLTVEELDRLPVLNKINVAARLRADILREDITGGKPNVDD